MGMFKQESMYERRKRELEEEAERVRKNLQSLMKTVKKDIDKPVGAALPAYNPSGKEPVDDCIVSVEEDETTEVAEPETETSHAPSSQLPPYGTARLRHFQNKKKENLPNYLATGSFGKRGPLSHEKKVQRNKAVFMAVLALIAVFSLISWLK